jgi:hypothetical protein
MRALVAAAACALAACTLAACSSSAPPPPEPTTGLTLTVEYSDRLANISLSGSTFATTRKFGPYVVSANKLQPGDTVGFTFAAADAGSAMICGDGRDRDGVMQASSCGVFAVRTGEITTGTLTLESVN